jgi:cytochrome P450 family 6
MLVEISIGLVTLIGIVYVYLTWKWKYWTKRGVYQIQPTFPFGSLPGFFTKSVAMTTSLMKHAEETKGLPYYGIYFLRGPILMITDVEIIRNILVKDFDNFVDRNSSKLMKNVFAGKTQSDKIWAQQLTSLGGDEWKNVRATFSPIFTSGKMKAMMVFIQEACRSMISSIGKCAENNEAFELKEMLGKYSMDSIASCAFGVDAQSYTNKDSLFVKYASNIFKQTSKDALKFVALILPGGRMLFDAFGVSLTKETETNFFYDAVIASLKSRRETKHRRNDLVDLMVDAIKGEIAEDKEHEDNQFEKDAKLNHQTKKGEFDELTIVASAIVFLVAGYDTTGTTLAFACYQLAKSPEVQDRLRAEVEDAAGESKELLTYDQIQDMHYLDQVISETLRFYNPAGVLQRSSIREYKVPGHDLVIEKDMNVWVNALAIHMDPAHYPNPTEFNPDNFSKENKAKRNP